jgi:subtilase family serine protease
MTRRLIVPTVVALIGGLVTAFLAFGQVAATAGLRHAAIDTAGLVRAPALTKLADGSYRLGEAPVVSVGSRQLGQLSSSTPLQLVVGLKPSNPSALATFATEVSTPGSAEYRHYLTVSQFASKYGATPAAISAVRKTLAAAGLNVGATSANNLSIKVSGSAGAIDKAFATTLEQYKLASGRVAFGNTSAPALPATIAGDVEAVIGLDNLHLPHPLSLLRQPSKSAIEHASPAALKALAAQQHLLRPRTTDPIPAGAANPCTAASTAAASDTDSVIPDSPVQGINTAAYSTNQFAQAYDYNPLYSAGDFGQGVTVGIFELEPNDPSDISAFETCYGTGNGSNVSYVEEDGGAGTFSASDEDGIETELDIENVVGLAPKATVVVYQAPNSNVGLIDNYTAMVENSAINVISTSWGECESEEGSGAADQENVLFQEAASEGKSVAAAAGDDGAEDCALPFNNPLPVGDVDEPQAAVDDPASQPFVTGAGGTSLTDIGDPASGTPPTEAVWNNGVDLALTLGGGAGGGGISSLWPMASYQTDAPTFLNVINSESSATTCTTAVGDCREVPDVTASADLYNAYLIYWDGGWTEVGGTSGAAPLWASIFTLADSNAGCASRGPIGFANPALYTAAGASAAEYAKTFNDITSGNNDLYDTNEGNFAAGADYDMASGLGSPIAANLVPALCAAATLVPPTGTTTTITTPGTTTTITEPGTTTTVTEPGTTTVETVTGTTTTVTEPPTTQTVTEPPTTQTVTTPATTQTVTTPGTTQTQTVTTPGTTVTTPGSVVTVYEYPSGGCTRMLTFAVKPHGSLRSVKVVVYLNGKKIHSFSGHALKKISFKHPAGRKFKLEIVKTLSNGEKVGEALQFNGCKYSSTAWFVVQQ